MAKIVTRKGNELSLEVTIELSGSRLEIEGKIWDAGNEMGCLATKAALEKFDAEGSPLMFGATKMTSQGKNTQTYQTPYGSVLVERHTYQTSKGGEIYCPLEEKAWIIRGATPKFAQPISHKYSNMNAPAVRNDLLENHHRKVAHSYRQDVSEYVGAIAQAKEEIWEYEAPELDEAVASVAVGLDGAHILMREEGYRESMVDNISRYGVSGERLHTIYIGQAPEYGKGSFFQRLEPEIIKTKKRYSNALYLGIADGAKNHWPLLEKHTDRQLLDFFHVTEYLAKAAYAAYPGKTDKSKREVWLHEHCTRLKHGSNSAAEIIDEMEKRSAKTSLTKKIKEDLSATVRYFRNHGYMMDYSAQIAQNLPIGSGITEAAGKTLVKQRLCCSGMRWKNPGAQMVLSLRALVQSTGRWRQFWERINQYGARIGSGVTS